MSLLEGTQRYVQTKTRGAASLPDEFDQALYAGFAHNMEIQLSDQAQTRRGFGQAPIGALHKTPTRVQKVSGPDAL